LTNVLSSTCRWLLVLPTLWRWRWGHPKPMLPIAAGLAPKEVCGLLAVGHRYPDALGGTLVGR